MAVKASEKQTICKKVITALKKRYRGAPPRNDRPVLETMLHACCLENTTWDVASEALDHLMGAFHELNEIRVSSVSEIEEALPNIEDADWRAMRIRRCLLYVFEKNYDYEFEGIKRKTLDLARKQLNAIPKITPFVRAHTLLHALNAHIVPLDDRMTNAAIWLGFINPSDEGDAAIDNIKSSVRKADVPLFCHLLRCLATDTKMRPAFDNVREDSDGEAFDVLTAAERLNGIIKSPPRATRKKKKAPAKKAPSKKASTKKAPAKKAAARTTGKAAKKKTTAKKTTKKAATKATKKKKRTTSR